MKIVALPKTWPVDKVLKDPMTKKEYFPAVEEVEVDEWVEKEKKTKSGIEVYREKEPVKRERCVYDVDLSYAIRLFDKTPNAFAKLEPSAKDEIEPKPEYADLDYRDLLAFYNQTFKKSGAGRKKVDLLNELDERFAGKSDGD